MRMKQHFLLIASLMFPFCQADQDVEDLIAQGYTCSLADYSGRTDIPKPGVEVVCDDGICAKCIKNRGVTPSPTINKEDPEDYLLDLSALNNSKTLLMLQMFVMMVTVLDAR